jgi:hypothetical protein
MKNLKLIITVFLPAFLCLIFFKLIKEDIYHALTFGLIIGMVNWKIHKYNKLLSIFLSIVSSNFVYFLSALLYVYLMKIIEFFKVDTNVLSVGDILFKIITFIVAPLLLFYVYKFVFNIKKNKFTLWTIIIAVFSLMMISVLPIKDNKDNFFNLFSLWQVIMAFSLQLILYQNEIKSLFKK